MSSLPQEPVIWAISPAMEGLGRAASSGRLRIPSASTEMST